MVGCVEEVVDEEVWIGLVPRSGTACPFPRMGGPVGKKKRHTGIALVGYRA